MKKPILIFICAVLGFLTCVLSFTAAGRFLWWVFLLGILLLLLAFFLFYLYHREGSGGNKPGGAALKSDYRAKDAMMTYPELVFYRALCQALEGRYEIVPQAALLAFIEKETHTSYRNELFRIIDFVIAERGTFRPLLAVELNDSSHKRADRQARDEKVAAILGNAGLPLLIVTPGEAYDVRDLRKHLLRLL
ncbi:MAG: DUF2726 domain-containing protein [Clostridiales bacterium]|jgi:hypothetical protein|nr:DUF2726 domain-containing protein [Clostridiales bacterium]